MSSSLDLTVPGDVSACRTAAGDASTAAQALTAAASAMTSSMRSVGSVWTGDAGDAFDGKLRGTRKDLDQLHDRVSAVGTALSTFADTLAVAKSDMATARAVALAGGLTVTGETVQRPDAVADDATDSQVTAYNAKVTAWNKAVEHAGDGRTKETAAHTALDDALQKHAGDGWLEKLLEALGFAPPSNLGVPGNVLWGTGLLGTASGTAADWMIKGRYGTFQPRVNGVWASPSDFSRLRQGWMSGWSKNWHATAGAAETRGAWSAAGKWVTRAGVVVSFGTAAWSQWEQDADDPSLDTTAKVSRSATVGVSTAAGAWAGAEAGGWIGGAIGTAICPGVGTVVGGALGGLIGGFAGSEVGGAVGDMVKDEAGKAADAVGDFVGGAGQDIGHVASDVGDALSFWN